MPKLWKKGRGKLGPLLPLHGTWDADADSEMGPVHCRRMMTPILDGKYLQLSAIWKFQAKNQSKRYEELAVIGPGADGQVRFWSFTSDGKRSEGWLTDVTDVHPEAVGFEADMEGRRARMAYWPADDGGFFWIVEAKTKKGWNRFVEHRYRRVQTTANSG